MNTDNHLMEKDSLHEALDLLQEIQDMEHADDADYRRLVAHIGRKRRHRNIRRIAIAAAAIALLIVSGTLRTGRHRDDIDSLVRSNRPMLELPGGEQFMMGPGVQDNLIADRSDVSVRIDGGVLRYERKGGASGVAFNTLHVPKGSPSCDIVLEDGTRVWLNAGSRLRFPSVFPEGERRVHLDGEAYFEVARNEKQPFIVATEDQSVKVLGTEFNISAYGDETRTVTTLIGGSVEICGVQDGTAIVLRPGQQASLDRGTGLFTLNEHVATDDYVAWKNGLINMEKRTLEEIVQSLSRLYDVEIVFADDRAKAISYRGSIPRYEKLTDVLKVIETGSPVGFSVSNNAISVRHE